MTQFFTRDTKYGDGQPVKVIWEYDSRCHLSSPERSFNEKIVPAVEKKECWYFGELLLNCLYHIELKYNFQRVLFLSLEDITRDYFGSRSFPHFVRYHLSKWAEKEIAIYKDQPTKPFRFTCKAYDSGPYVYYLEATTEAALMRDFKENPPTEIELAIWRALRKTKTPANATIESKTQFLIEYSKRVATKQRIKLNNYRIIEL